MRKYFLIIALFFLSFMQTTFAMGKNDVVKECETIANACKSAGYTDEGMGDKSFWFGCMKPVLLGKSVSDVTVDVKDVRACRRAKIAKMKKEIRELQSSK